MRIKLLSSAATLVLTPYCASAATAQQQSTPLPTLTDPGFETATGDDLPQRWYLIGRDAGYTSLIDGDRPHTGRTSVRLGFDGTAEPAQNAFGSVATYLDATPYRGRRVRLSAAVRTRQPASTVGLVLRVDRPGGIGAFDNMQDRPIRTEQWRDYMVEADVAPDARGIFLGFIVSGRGTAWMDDVRLEDIGPARTPPIMVGATQQRPREGPRPNDRPAREISPSGLTNVGAFARAYGTVRHFYPSEQAAQADWDRIAVAGIEPVEAARSPSELAAALNRIFQPVAPDFRAWPTATAPAPQVPPAPRAGAQAINRRYEGHPGTRGASVAGATLQRSALITGDDIHTEALPGGVTIHVPLKLWDTPGDAARRLAPPAATGAQQELLSGHDRSTRLAAIVSAWSTLRDFYPYFDVVQVDWPAELNRALISAATDHDDVAFVTTLRRLVAALDDGHGSVQYWRQPQGALPLAWDWIQGQLVVTAVADGTAGVRRGDVVRSIDGRPAGELLRERMALHSGSVAWKRERAQGELSLGPAGAGALLTVVGPDGAERSLTLPFRTGAGTRGVPEPRPEAVAELEPGLLYVDLSRSDPETLQQHMAQLATARGIVFDLRGYPRGNPWYLRHMIDGPAQSPSFDVPLATRPNQQGLTFDRNPWQLLPEAPRFTRNVVFLTDERAISFAESVLGTVKGNRIGRIVGSPSAGANGNVANLTLPGGYAISWTSLRTLNQDGSRHHILGVQPDVPVERTLAGVRAGRDEVLERGVALVREGLALAAR